MLERDSCLESPKGQIRQHPSEQEASPVPFMAKTTTGREKEKKHPTPLCHDARNQPAQELRLQALKGETMPNNKRAATFWTRSSSQVDCKTQPCIYVFEDQACVYFYCLVKEN